jgi:phosphate transport system protein
MVNPRHIFDDELKNLRADLLRMGTLAREAVDKSIKALINRDMNLADEVIIGDDVIDKMDLDIEMKCMELIARQQPMARDLRTIGTILKTITDLERIADHAVDIAKIAKILADQPPLKPYIDIPRMCELSLSMLDDALKSFVNEDVDLAKKMCERDDLVDALYNQVFRELLTYMMEDPKAVVRALYLIFVARFLERVADHATNVGERVVYMVTGVLKELNV